MVLTHRRPAKAQASLHILTVWPEPSLTNSPTKNQTSSPTGWLRMRIWRMSLWRTKSTIISCSGSYHMAGGRWKDSDQEQLNSTSWPSHQTSCLMTKPTKWHPAKTQSDQSSLSACRRLGSLATHWGHSKDSDQTGRMPRLIWVVAGRTVILLVLSWGGSYGKEHKHQGQHQERMKTAFSGTGERSD